MSSPCLHTALWLSILWSQFKPHPLEGPLPLTLGHPIQLTLPHVPLWHKDPLCSEHCSSAVILLHPLLCLFPLKWKIIKQGPCLPCFLLSLRQSGSLINICGTNEWDQMSSPELCLLPSLSFLTRAKEDSGWNKSTEGSSLGYRVVIQLSACPTKYAQATYRVKKQKWLGWLTPTHNVHILWGKSQVIYPEIIPLL